MRTLRWTVLKHPQPFLYTFFPPSIQYFILSSRLSLYNFDFDHFIQSHHCALHFNPFLVSSHTLNRVHIHQNDMTQHSFALWYLPNFPLLTPIIFQLTFLKSNSTQMQKDCRLGHVLHIFQLLQTCFPFLGKPSTLIYLMLFKCQCKWYFVNLLRNSHLPISANSRPHSLNAYITLCHLFTYLFFQFDWRAIYL